MVLRCSKFVVGEGSPLLLPAWPLCSAGWSLRFAGLEAGDMGPAACDRTSPGAFAACAELVVIGALANLPRVPSSILVRYSFGIVEEELTAASVIAVNKAETLCTIFIISSSDNL